MSLSLNRHYFFIRNLTFVFCLLPLIYQFRWVFSTALPANIFAQLSHTFGHSAMILLVFTLAITPLRRWFCYLFRFIPLKWGKRLADWNFLIRLRRPVGNLAFLYMCLHMLVYFYLELDFIWEELFYELEHRVFLLPAVFAWGFSALLALTSPMIFRKIMGQWWRHLHRLMYLICVLAAVHYLWFAKVSDRLPWLYIALIAILLLHRVLVFGIRSLKRKDDTGMEAKPR